MPTDALLQTPTLPVSLHHNRDVKKHIYIYSPSSAVRDKAAFKRGVKRLEFLGHAVEVDADALTSHQRFAGDDATRLAALHRAAASGADIALVSRGGYGLTRILPSIRYKSIAKSIERGTRFVGFSDFTALQLALFTKTGCTTWAGPDLCSGFGVDGAIKVGLDGACLPPSKPDEIMEDCFNDLITGQGEGSGWRQPHETDTNGAAIAANFQVKGATLWGGNLSLVSALLGTPYFPEVKGGILFLEDVGEHPYRIERLLTHLLLAGVVARQKAIVLGQFTDYKLSTHDKGFKLKSVVQWLRSQTRTPVLTNLPFGHVQTKVLLPMGAKTDLLVEGQDVLLYWGHAD